MRKINEARTLGELVNGFAFLDGISDRRMQYFIKNSTIFSFWEDIVGCRFAKYTKPRSIKYSKLYVAAKSPVIVQELILLKDKLIKKVNTYSMPLGITVKDIIFDYKTFAPEKNAIFVEDKPVFYSEAEIENTEIDEAFRCEIKKSVEKINFLDEQSKQKLIQKIYNVNRAKNKRTNG